MARVEIHLVLEDRADGKSEQTMFGAIYQGETAGMERMEELNVHECMAYALAYLHAFHSGVGQKMKGEKPAIQIARVHRAG